MTNNEKFDLCLTLAQRIVQAEHDAHPGCEDVVALKVSGGVSNTDTNFERQGTTANDISYSLPPELSSLLTANAQQASPNAGLANGIGSFLAQLLGQNNTDVPSKTSLDTILGLSPTSFGGSTTLNQIAQRNPYSSTFEADTESSYRQRAANAMSQVQSGPGMVRGGTARPAIAQAQLSENLARERGNEVRSAQGQEFGQVSQASQLLNMIESARRGLQLQAQGAHAGQSAQRTGQGLQAANVGEMQKGTNIGLLQLASNMLGAKKQLTTDNLTGKGTENRSFVQGEGGLSCCFIFMTAMNGPLPWYINLARRDYLTPRRKAGYSWMASLLVPAMRRYAWAKRAVNAVIVRPFLKYGAYLYGASEKGRFWAPYCKGWLATWSAFGQLVKGAR